MDRLSALLQGLAPRVTLTRFAHDQAELPIAATEPARLYLYLLMRGGARFRWHDQRVEVEAPCMVICRSDAPHDIVCSSAGGLSGLARAEAWLHGPVGELLLDTFVGPRTVALDEAESSLRHTISLIASELDQARCGQPALLQRAGDILFIGVLRQLVASPQGRRGGILDGLADARLARALVSIHTLPNAPWTLERLAAEAGMSRTAFAQRFRDVMRVPPGRYLQVVRLAIARDAVKSGQGLKQAAKAAGYQSTAALSRALSRPALT